MNTEDRVKRAILLILLLVMLVIIVEGCNAWCHNYTVTATVVERTDYDEVYCDTEHNEWCFKVDKNSDIAVGDVIVLKMYDNRTDYTIEDDIITDFEYKDE